MSRRRSNEGVLPETSECFTTFQENNCFAFNNASFQQTYSLRLALKACKHSSYPWPNFWSLVTTKTSSRFTPDSLIACPTSASFLAKAKNQYLLFPPRSPRVPPASLGLFTREQFLLARAWSQANAIYSKSGTSRQLSRTVLGISALAALGP